ncbi:MAG: sigma-70 family RNA polymerase sigma factor [Planctomycetota bacterium]
MPELPQTRRSLLLQLRQRSDDAWHRFLEVYEQAIYRSCRARGLQHADACDVTQEVLTAVDQRLAQTGSQAWDEDPERGSFRGWLFRVARNIAVRRIDERARQAAVGSGDSRVAAVLAEVPASRDAQDTAFGLEYRRALMRWASEQVRPHVADSSWQAFWRTAILGQRPEDVAAQLGMSMGSVYTAKCRVFARIRKVIAGLDTHELERFQLDVDEPLTTPDERATR